jgi:hypothetical protein
MAIEAGMIGPTELTIPTVAPHDALRRNLSADFHDYGGIRLAMHPVSTPSRTTRAEGTTLGASP